MREIKFRAWDKRFNLMLYPDNFYNEYISADGKVIEIEEWSDYSGGGFHTNDVSQDYILMQYTGLKDGTKWEQLTKEEQNDWLQSGKKPEEWKGREIYEGDIYESEDGRDKGVIIFQNCSFEVKWIPPATFGLRSLLYYNQNGKVVGNIYENPEIYTMLNVLR